MSTLTDLEAKLTADLAAAKAEYATLVAKSYPGKTVALIAAGAFVLGLIVGVVVL